MQNDYYLAFTEFGEFYFHNFLWSIQFYTN